MRSIQYALVLFCALTAFGERALAHAHLVKSSPDQASSFTEDAAPTQVSLEFSEDLETKMSKVLVRSGTEAATDFTEGAVTSPEGKKNVLEVKLKHPLRAGIYLVKWKTMAVDTHKMSGEYRFTVKPGAK